MAPKELRDILQSVSHMCKSSLKNSILNLTYATVDGMQMFFIPRYRGQM
jgi:hypothetical protein